MKHKMKASFKLTAVFEEAPEGGYMSYIEEIAGVNSQGETLEEAKANLAEALELVLETQRMLTRQEQQDKNLIRENLELV
jgi:predicted RNase H-like HicB family nuclease